MGALYDLSPTEIILYGVGWCGDCRRARRIFAERAIPYVDIDIEQDEQAMSFVKKLNRGNQSVPTIVFPDGTTLTEPDSHTLSKKLEDYQPTA
jgi:mycoredoxin